MCSAFLRKSIKFTVVFLWFDWFLSFWLPEFNVHMFSIIICYGGLIIDRFLEQLKAWYICSSTCLITEHVTATCDTCYSSFFQPTIIDGFWFLQLFQLPTWWILAILPLSRFSTLTLSVGSLLSGMYFVPLAFFYIMGDLVPPSWNLCIIYAYFRNMKNGIIGNNRQKMQLISLGVVPR